MKNLPFLLCCFLFILGCGSPKTTNQTANQTNQPASTETVTVSAVELTKAYQENEIAADDKYKGKTLEVSGKVSNISDVLNTIQIDLEGIKQSGINVLSVKCLMDNADRPNVAKLKVGQNTVLVGIGDGKTMTLYAGLKNCKIK